MLLRTREVLSAALAVDDPGTAWLAVAALGALIVVLVALGTHNRRAGGQLGAGTARMLRRAGRNCALTGGEIRVLQNLVGVGHYRQEADLLRNRALLDGVLLRGRAALPAAPRMRHTRRLAVLLSIKARIEAGSEATIHSSSSIRAGTRIVVIPALIGSYRSEVLASLRDEIACRIPGDETGVELRWRRGALVTVHVAPVADGTIPLLTTVAGYGWVGGRQALLLARAVPPAARRMQRPQRGCVVTRVIARLSVDDGEQQQQAMLLSEQRSRGTLQSVVAGRASIRSPAPLRPGSLVKVELELGAAAWVPLYGKVVRGPRRAAAGGVMQVQLTRLSHRHLNDLYGFVDEFPAALPAATGPAVSW